jgi:hypothetical protein
MILEGMCIWKWEVSGYFFGLFTGLEAIYTLTLLLGKYLSFTIASNIVDNS